MHRPQEASAAYETMISHPAVRKCNFTGSTPVGRLIASRAAASLKPVLLELGGKNFAIILDDADLDKSARLTLEGAFLNVRIPSSLVIQPTNENPLIRHRTARFACRLTPCSCHVQSFRLIGRN
jgi:hypothetical protein